MFHPSEPEWTSPKPTASSNLRRSTTTTVPPTTAARNIASQSSWYSSPGQHQQNTKWYLPDPEPSPSGITSQWLADTSPDSIAKPVQSPRLPRKAAPFPSGFEAVPSKSLVTLGQENNSEWESNPHHKEWLSKLETDHKSVDNKWWLPEPSLSEIVTEKTTTTLAAPTVPTVPPTSFSLGKPDWSSDHGPHVGSTNLEVTNIDGEKWWLPKPEPVKKTEAKLEKVKNQLLEDVRTPRKAPPFPGVL